MQKVQKYSKAFEEWYLKTSFPNSIDKNEDVKRVAWKAWNAGKAGKSNEK